MEEIFKHVPDSGYFVSNFGRVKNLAGDFVYLNKTGYTQLQWKVRGKRFNKYLHRMVYELFIGPIPPGLQINHIDGDKTNNALGNLEPVTSRENLHKAISLGLVKKATRPKLTESQVRQIKKQLSRGESARIIASKYGVNEFTISDIKTGRSWRWV